MSTLIDADPKDYRRLSYQYDPGVRRKQINWSLRNQGLKPLRDMAPHSYTIGEVLDRLGVHALTFRKWERLGLIPVPTYPSRHRKYWRHQFELLRKFVTRMRSEGWPDHTPKIAGCADWTAFLRELQEAWTRDGPIHVKWKPKGSLRDGVHHP